MINYEIIFAYLDDAKKAYQEEKWEEFKVALRKAQNSIGELMQTLDFLMTSPEIFTGFMFSARIPLRQQCINGV